MAREKKEPDQPAGCPAWLATYGDMITLVLTFFVLLYSMSTVDTEKWKALVMNMGGDPYLFDSPLFTANEGNTGAIAAPELDIEDIIEESEDWFQAEVVSKLEEILEEFNKKQSGGGENLGNFELEYTTGDRFVILRIQNEVLFDSAKADLKPEALPYIDVVIVEIMDQINAGTIEYILIQGHADERRLASTNEFKDNMDLSFERARSAMTYILDNYPIDPVLLIPSGRGELVPLVNESNEQAWRQNRRVEFYIYKNAEYDPAARNP